MNFLPKWRSSLAVYFYIVPEEETADSYPNSRIVYLKLTCSITGWNPSESLHAAKSKAQETGPWDDVQRTFWETIVASGWAQKYWPCLGAIMQIAVYPNSPDGVSPDDYPYIMDFEPKKRELYEAVSEGKEVLSGSSDKTSLTKGSTTVNTLEYGAGGGFSIGGFGASASINKTKSDTTINQNTTDTSREARETVSRSTSSSQMYQLFNGYHLGTNRALFVVAPRPHTVSSAEETEFNLIDGERKLEGIQDVFLVVHMPKSLDGFCIQAGLNTGHTAITLPQHIIFMDEFDPENPGGDLPDYEDPPPPPPTQPVKQLIITRRVVQSCGTFDENGNFNLRQLREPGPEKVIGEIALPTLPTRAIFRSTTRDFSRNSRITVANNSNTMQSEINNRMLDVLSSVNYEPRDFEETDVFKSLAAYSVRKIKFPLSRLASKGYISRQAVQSMSKIKITTVGDLFSSSLEETETENANRMRRNVLEKILGKQVQ
jgi:hypothetical protein